MRFQRALSLFFLLTVFVVSKGKKLPLKEVCNEYLKCNEDLEEMSQSCEMENGKETKYTEHCRISFYNDFRQLEELTAGNKDATVDCVRHSVKTPVKYRFPKEKVRFCSPFLRPFDESKENRTCSMSIMRMKNRCQALRQCCDPAPRCEQATEYSEAGRKVTALKEELDIKMAGCLQNSGRTVEEAMKFEKEELCPKYLRCQKDLLQLRSKCSIALNLPKGGDAYSWSLLYNELSQPIDVNDFECKLKFSKQYDDVLKRRKQAQDYLEHCVPVANVTREFREKQLPCEPEELRLVLPSEQPTEECLSDVVAQNKECLKLRNCCIQADVCERNALYGVLADEYLLAVTALKSKMDICYQELRKRT